MIPSPNFTCRFAALAAPLALLPSTAFFPTTSANASEPQRSERSTPIVSVTAATRRAADAIAQPVDPPGHQGESILDDVRQDIERLISHHKKLQARASSLAADLEREKAWAKELLSERDQALGKVKESAASIARLEARWRAAQNALIVERKRHEDLQQQQEQALKALRSELSAMRQKRDTLKAQFDDLVGKTEPTPDSGGQTEAAPEAAQTPPTNPTPPPAPLQLGQNSQQRVASLDQTHRPEPVGQEAQQKLKNATKEKIESFLSQHRGTLQKAQDSLGSVDPDITEVRFRLVNAGAAIDGMTIPPNIDPDPRKQTMASAEELAARLEEKANEITKTQSTLNGLSLETGTISKAFESIQEKVGRLEEQQHRVKSEAREFKQIEAQLNQRFDDVRKRTLELETAAELLRIRQVLSDFRMGRIERASLAQHESTLQAIATNLGVLANDFAKAKDARGRLLIRGDSLRGQVALFDTNLKQLRDAGTDLSTRVEAWLERARAAHPPPLDDLVAMLQEIKQGVRQHAAAGSALQALAERLSETLKATESDVRAVSTVLRDRQKTLQDQIERLGHLSHTNVTATEAGQSLASCGPSSNEPKEDNAAVAGTQPNECQEIHRFLMAVGHVREELAARLRQVTKLSETADDLNNALRLRETAIAKIGRDVAESSRINQDDLGRVDRLGASIGSLTERHSTHHQRLSEQSKTIATLQEQLTALTKGLTEAAAEPEKYAPAPTGDSTAEDLDAKELSNRLDSISDRVALLNAAIVALKRPPPPPTKLVSPPTANSAEPDNDRPRVAGPERATEIGVACNPALTSCRRWHYLREQRALKAKSPADERLEQKQPDRP